MTRQSSLDTAVLLIFFNRLETTREVLSAIRKVSPKRLYCASDGPRDQEEASKVIEIRDHILADIDWECGVKTLFHDHNLGCGHGVKGAVDWFFEHEEDGIILEDDVVPDESFFYFCDELLERYRDDQRIGMISGNNHFDYSQTEDSYLFSMHRSTWGWATWRRAWANMDLDTNWYDTSERKSIIANMGHSDQSNRFWEHILAEISTGYVDAWDYQWFFSLAAQNQLSIVPKDNLVANIGFGEDATHTFGTAKDAYVQTKAVRFPLTHPKYIVPDDSYTRIVEADLRKNIWKTYIPLSLKTFIKHSIR